MVKFNLKMALEALNKIVVKNFKPKINSNEEIEIQQEEFLNKSIPAILQSKSHSHSLEELYFCVENLCTQGKAEDIYKILEYAIAESVSTIETSLLNIIVDKFLEELSKCWQNFCKNMLIVRNIYLYLDRTYVLQTPSLLSVWNLGLLCFRKIVVSNDKISSKIKENLFLLVSEERRGERIRIDLMRTITMMLNSLGLYHEIFEKNFIKESEIFYHNESNDLITQLEIPDYLLQIEKRLHEENIRVSNYLQICTRSLLMDVVNVQMLSHHAEKILSGLSKMLDNNKVDQLRLLNKLFENILSGIQQLNDAFLLYVIHKVKSIVSDKQNDKYMIQNLLNFKDKIDYLTDNAFIQETHYNLNNSIRDAFKVSINKRANKPAELIAKYLDAKLRTGNKEATDEEMESLLDKLMILFRLVNGKDVFKAFYKKDLAKRLLLSKSANVDYEKSMLSKLKEECGAGFTCKLEGMFSDIFISKDINMIFKQYLQDRPFDFSVNVLTTGNWPSYKFYSVQLPPELNNMQAIFSKFYTDKHQGRKLRWQSSLGHCILKAVFGETKKELHVSLFQTLVLLMFNDAQSLSYNEIQSAINLQVQELHATLQSLACGKSRVLVKNPKSKDVENGDTFIFNVKFTDPLFRIKINQLQMKETTEEQKETEKSVFQDRQYQIDAAIVRIMKQKQILKHNVLLSELFQTLEFPIKPPDLKIRIESLIERDYIARDEIDPNQYNYIC